MSKIYIFGDSFFSRWVEDNNTSGWIVQLHAKYPEVINTAVGGASNHEIYLNYLKYIDDITPDDIILFGWSDPSRFYVNPGITKDEKIYKLYYANFYNKTLSMLQEKTYMSEVKNTITEKNLKALFFWSFPSAYVEVPRENFNWLDSMLIDITDQQYYYSDTFENEIKPALIYFSKKEVADFKSPDKVVHYFQKQDKRPNHIGDQAIHDELVKIVVEFIENQTSGQIDIIKRLNNGA
jgi:hypothetical protein